MKRRRILLLLALVAVGAGIVLIAPRGPKEPVYEGKRLTQWIEECYNRNTAESRETSRRVLKAMGTNALPFLLHQFAQKDSRWTASLKNWVYSHRMMRAQYDADMKRLYIINFGLHSLGADAAPGLPELARYVDESPRGEMALSVMGNSGIQALPYLLKAMDSTNTAVWPHAGRGILGVYGGTKYAVPTFIRLMSHSNGWVRANSAAVLAGFWAQSDLVIPALVRALSDPDLQVQHVAINSLGKMGAAARPATPELVRLMKDPASTPRLAASNALFLIDPAALRPRGP